MASFPPAGVKEDSKHFKVTLEDKSLNSETDGGYVYSRPRHNRPPRRTFKTGFTDISEFDKLQIQSFAETHGMYLIFSYQVPDTGETVNVRFSESLPNFQYKGFGGNHRYDVTDIQLTEV